MSLWKASSRRRMVEPVAEIPVPDRARVLSEIHHFCTSIEI